MGELGSLHRVLLYVLLNTFVLCGLKDQFKVLSKTLFKISVREFI